MENVLYLLPQKLECEIGRQGGFCVDALLLNFPTFYQSAIKNNTSLPQFNAVSVLLLGNVRDQCMEESIDDPSVSGYVSGKKPIRKSILTPLLSLSHEEAVRRLHMLGIQDIQRMVDALAALIGEVSNLSSTAKAPLLELMKTSGTEYDFVAEVFLLSVKCPAVFKHRLSREAIRHLNSLGWPEQATSGSNAQNPSEGDRKATPESSDISEPTNDAETVHTSFKFSQEERKVAVSYRSLTIPDDKETAASYLLNLCENSLVNLDYADIISIVSEENGFHCFMAELRGTWQSIVFELSRWMELSNCIGCILQLVVSENAGLESIDEVASKIRYLIPAEATFLFGVKLSPEFLLDQTHVCAIFRMRDAASENDSMQKSPGPRPVQVHKVVEEDPFEEIYRIFNKDSSHPQGSQTQPDEDPFEDIFRIFNKGKKT